MGMNDQPAPRLLHGDEGGPLSRRLVTIRVVRLVNFIIRSSALAFHRTSGLSDFEWRILARICETPPLSINELGGLLNRNVGQVSRTAKRLVAAGLVKRENRGGGPGVLLTPTPRGQIVYAPLEQLAIERDAVLTRGFTESEIADLVGYIERLTENALILLGREQAIQAGESEDVHAHR
jgi:DNA-binding MarR family transcriptional regulator